VVERPAAVEPLAALTPVPDPPELPALDAERSPATSAAEVEARLVALEPLASTRAAMEVVLAAWRVRPLDPQESRFPDDLERIAWRRGLEVLPITGNRSMLFLLDLPAIVELRVPGASGSRWVSLTGMDDRNVMLTVDGTVLTVDAAFLDRFWFGRAHILWRDFESLGRTFAKEARGPQVARMQQLLRRAGVYDGAATGHYDGATGEAVLRFQRSHLLVADGIVGRLTRIVLYAVAGGYPRPTLASASGGVS
jgi:general secretion pathway protein A